MKQKKCPYIDGKCGTHAQCVKCARAAPRDSPGQEENMNQYGAFLDPYDQQIVIYRLYSDGSKRKILTFYEKDHFIHLSAQANHFKYIPELENLFDVFSQDMIGVDLPLYHQYLLDSGMENLLEV